MPSVTLVANVSGGGRTVLNLLDEIEAGRLDARVALVVADRRCKAIERLEARGQAVELMAWGKGTTPEEYAARYWPRAEQAGATLVCNAGFLRFLLIPPEWEGKVMNIHPALLPKFGGKGMYGDHVHAAVLGAGEAESGCTVHFANNVYDEGPIIVQKRVPVLPGDSVDTLAARVFEAECKAYPEAIRLFGEGRLRIENGKVTIR